jgi:hypothetical protein
MEAVHTSETSIYFNETTQHCIPESSHLHFSCWFFAFFVEMVTFLKTELTSNFGETWKNMWGIAKYIDSSQ